MTPCVKQYSYQLIRGITFNFLEEQRTAERVML